MNARKEVVIVTKRCNLDACTSKRGTGWCRPQRSALIITYHGKFWERGSKPRHSLPISACAEVVGTAELPFLLTFSVAERDFATYPCNCHSILCSAS